MRSFAVLFFFFSISFVSYSQTKIENIQKLFKLMKSEELMGTVVDNSVAAGKAKLLKELEGKYDSSQIDSVVKFLEKELTGITKKFINEDLVLIYDKYYTEKEIKELIAFYKSSVGKKTIELAPEISKETMKVMTQEYIPIYFSKLQQKVKQILSTQKPPKEDKI